MLIRCTVEDQKQFGNVKQKDAEKFGAGIENGCTYQEKDGATQILQKELCKQPKKPRH